MFSRTPELYDRIYGSFKDYAAESAQLAALLADVAPSAQTVLDVACGTGTHVYHLRREHGYKADGLDIESGFVELARQKVSEARFWQGDMAAFDLSQRFDVVLCLFSAIGYVRTLDRLQAALACFHSHLNPAGVVVVEPWFAPDQWRHGRVYVHDREDGPRRVVRMSHSAVNGKISELEFHYLIGGPDGIEHRIETHELGLFTSEEMMAAFAAAGFVDIHFDPQGLTGRGLYVARTQEGSE